MSRRPNRLGLEGPGSWSNPTSAPQAQFIWPMHSLQLLTYEMTCWMSNLSRDSTLKDKELCFVHSFPGLICFVSYTDGCQQIFVECISFFSYSRCTSEMGGISYLAKLHRGIAAVASLPWHPFCWAKWPSEGALNWHRLPHARTCPGNSPQTKFLIWLLQQSLWSMVSPAVQSLPLVSPLDKTSATLIKSHSFWFALSDPALVQEPLKHSIQRPSWSHVSWGLPLSLPWPPCVAPWGMCHALPPGFASSQLLWFNFSCRFCWTATHHPAPYIPLNKCYFNKVITGRNSLYLQIKNFKCCSELSHKEETCDECRFLFSMWIFFLSFLEREVYPK